MRVNKMFLILLQMLFHKKLRFVLTAVGLGVAFFLTAVQTGLLVGWCNTTSAIIRHAGVDVWVMAPQTPAFDYGTPIPRQCIYRARTVPGVAWAEGLFAGYSYWQRADGKQVNVLLVGLDDSKVGGPWQMMNGSISVVDHPQTVVTDALYLKKLGIRSIGDEVEMLGQRAVVGAICSGVRTFTTVPLVFLSLNYAIVCNKRYRDDEITYVLVRCSVGSSPEEVKQAMAAALPDVEVLTSSDFARRTMSYWMLETGAGITVVLVALLSLLVATVITSQTLFAITQEHLPNHATLLALGFSRAQLAGVVLGQSAVLGLSGALLGSGACACACRLSATTPVPIETTPAVFSALVGICLGCCLLASFVSLRSTLLQRQSALRVAEAELLHLRDYVRPEDRDLAETKVRLAEAKLAVARQQLADTSLAAPCAGTVLEILRREGEGVRLTDTDPVLLLGDLSKLRVRAEIDERFARLIRAGQEAVLFGRGLGDATLETRVAAVKAIMGKKTVFSRAATERKDLDVLQVFVNLPESFTAPVGLQLDIKVHAAPNVSNGS
jgi:putative ABC transport system permease protein